MFSKIISFSLISLMLISAPLIAKCGYLEVNGAEIYYQLTGKGKQTIVFIQGVPATSEIWQCQVKEFSKQFKCLTLDLPGLGRSTVSPTETYTAASLASTVQGVIAALACDGVENPIMITSSISSFIGLTYALTYTTGNTALSRLVLVDGTAYIPEGVCYVGLSQNDIDCLLCLASNNYPAFIEVSLAPLAAGPCGPSEALTKLVNDLSSMFLGEICSNVAAVLTNFALNTDLRLLVSNITIPTLIVYGGIDSTLPIEQSFFLRSQIPNSILFELCNKNHLPFLTDVQRFNKEVKKFICNDLCDCDICDLHVTPAPQVCQSPTTPPVCEEFCLLPTLAK